MLGDYQDMFDEEYGEYDEYKDDDYYDEDDDYYDDEDEDDDDDDDDDDEDYEEYDIDFDKLDEETLYTHYDDDDDSLKNIDVKVADEWYDANDAQDWTILNEVENEFDQEWQEDELWDEIDNNIEALSGHSMRRKCMNIFGRKLCIYEFLNWIKFGETRHQCSKKGLLRNRN